MSTCFRRSLLVLLGLCAACDRSNTLDDGGANDDAHVGDLSGGLLTDFACAVGGAQATIKHLNLRFVYDRSNSMGGANSGIDPATKWLPVGAGLKSFFQDAASNGVTASLVYFPSVKNEPDECNSGEYTTADVGPVDLPSSTFATSIDATSPSGNTPTLPAVQGVIGEIQSGAANPKEADAIILVTDGEPDSCESSVNDVSQAVMSVASLIPTYVIGIGLSSAALDQIAAAGGTTKAIVVDISDPTQTQTELQTALDKIRGDQVPCTFDIPAAPAGQTLDYDKVNVLYTPSVGAQQALTADKTCQNGAGWYYVDGGDSSTPTKIQLCPTSCTTVQQDKGARIDILLGCDTQGMIN